MKMKIDKEEISITMSRYEFARLYDIISMADIDFEQLDDAISAGGAMTREDMDKIVDAWSKMTSEAGWPRTGRNR